MTAARLPPPAGRLPQELDISPSPREFLPEAGGGARLETGDCLHAGRSHTCHSQATPLPDATRDSPAASTRRAMSSVS